MAKTVAVIGIQTDELGWVHMLLRLLRHPDPQVGELTRAALLYVSDLPNRREAPHSTVTPTGS